LAEARLRVAREFLADAKLCLDNGRFRSAVSRAYYGAFHACVALFEHYGYQPSHFLGRDKRPARRWEHGIVRKYFPIEFVHKRKLVDWQLGIGLSSLYESRAKADYRVDMRISETMARSSFEKAQRLVQVVEGEAV
jgi:uncharacterized protein (UPF0332 family)